MRLTFKYKNYPLSPELTRKSQRVGQLTHPLYGVMLGGILLLAGSALFPNAVAPALVLGAAGMVGGPFLLLQLRKKKFAQFDAEYEKILRASK